MKKLRLMLLLTLLFGCKDKYVASIHLPATGYLVVEGFINAGNEPTNISLTRATSLDSIYINPESGATVTVESENSGSFPLTEISPGQYSIAQIPVDATQKYRLHILTAGGKEYVSDYAEVKITPAVDSVSYSLASDAANIFVSTHDSQNKTLYYQWQYDETWLYLSPFTSYYTYTDSQIQPRDFNTNQINQCWESDISTNIVIGSSAKLSSDVISNLLLTKVPYAGNFKLAHRYSILVKQYALTKDWYDWKEKIKKNTEQLGSIFDAQPSQVAGNIHAVSDPSETVIGYIGCSTETEKRIFIDNSELPVGITYDNLGICTSDSLMTLDSAKLAFTFTGNYYIPITYIYNLMGMPIGITYSSHSCVDCRAHGGVNVPPDFWQ
jgi:hypothetical protein